VDRVFEEDTRQIVTARRELAAAVIELQEHNRALRDEARTDALTGLRNRPALNEVLELTVGADDSPWRRAGVAFVDVERKNSRKPPSIFLAAAAGSRWLGHRQSH